MTNQKFTHQDTLKRRAPIERAPKRPDSCGSSIRIQCHQGSLETSDHLLPNLV